MSDSHDNSPPRDAARRRSEKRRAQDRITFRLLPSERAALEADADAAHQSLGTLIRSRVLAASQTPGRRLSTIALMDPREIGQADPRVVGVSHVSFGA